MRYARVIPKILFAGLIAGLVAAFMAGAVAALVSAPQLSISAIAIGGFFGVGYGIKLTIGPAILLGGLLWLRRVRSALIWMGTGALGGLGGYCFLALPDVNYDVVAMFTAPEAFALLAACLAAGISGAFIFRLMMDTLTAFNDDGYDYD